MPRHGEAGGGGEGGCPGLGRPGEEGREDAGGGCCSSALGGNDIAMEQGMPEGGGVMCDLPPAGRLKNSDSCIGGIGLL